MRAILSTVTDTFTRVNVGQDSGEVRGAERSVARGRLTTKTSLFPGTQRFHRSRILFCLSVLVRTRLGLRANIAEKYVLLNAVLQVPQHCEACRGKELAAILLFVFMVPL